MIWGLKLIILGFSLSLITSEIFRYYDLKSKNKKGRLA